MNAVVSRCAPLIERAAPSLMPAMDIRNTNDRATFWELWDTRKPNADTVARYAVSPAGVFLGGAIVSPDRVMVALDMKLDEFLAVIRAIEASS